MNRAALQEAFTLMYHTVFTQCEMDGDRITAVIVFTKGGYYRIRATTFVDASADADVASSAGVTSCYGRESDHLAQPMTLNFHVYGVDREKVCEYVLDNLNDMFHMTPKNLRELKHYDISGAFSKIQAAKDAGEFHIDRDTVLCFETNTEGEYCVNMTRISMLSALIPLDFSSGFVYNSHDNQIGQFVTILSVNKTRDLQSDGRICAHFVLLWARTAPIFLFLEE